MLYYFSHSPNFVSPVAYRMITAWKWLLEGFKYSAFYNSTKMQQILK